MKTASVLLIISLLFSTCKPKDPVAVSEELSDEFGTPTLTRVQPDNILNECSGIADSQKQPGMIWAHEDWGSVENLYLLNRQGAIMGSIKMPFNSYDWEDMAVGPGPQANESYVYLAAIGDNSSLEDVKNIYRFVEPANLNTQVTSFDQIRFRYPDGSFDAEVLLLDPLTRDIFIVTKWTPKGHIYRLRYPQSTDPNVVTTAEKVGEMTIGGDLTGGAVSVTGREIIVRGYTGIYYWKRTPEQSIGEVLRQAPAKNLPYTPEPQGEAVTFDREGKGYFTLSERRSAPFINLHFYPRK
ncbi:MAG: PE-PGRS family protein [Spirosomaceae bacterium]|jgi:hypothetical protein|nr:PE-PGRS family protein [Spirosomataceae bacterium]